MAEPPDEESPKHALLVALGAMGGVALLVGLAIGAVVAGAVEIAGVGDRTSSDASDRQSLYMPEYQPTKSTEEDLGLPTYSPSASPSEREKRKERRERQQRLTLFVAPVSVAPGQRINFNGVYAGGEGVTLQVQRKEGGVWADFPVTATVRGGVFETWIQTSRTGRTQFRVLDQAAGRGSNPVTVTIG